MFVDAHGRLYLPPLLPTMDVLLQDLGPTGVIALYGEQLRSSRLRNTELENVRLSDTVLESGDDGVD